MNIKDCKAIVTGGASGLGEACIRNLVKGGAKAVILDLDQTRGEILAAELGNNVFFVKTDVTSDESVQSAINKAVEAFGGLNVAINCAGIGDPGKMLSKKGPMPLATFNRMIQSGPENCIYNNIS